MKKLLLRMLKRNHQLYKKWKLEERLVLCLIREEDNAHQRNIKAVEYIDENLKRLSEFKTDGVKLSSVIREYQELRKILTIFKTTNILDEANKEVE